MDNMIKMLQNYKNALYVLEQKFDTIKSVDLEEYHDEICKIVNGIIECISLPINNKIEYSEYCEGTYLGDHGIAEQEESKKKIKCLEKALEDYQLITEHVTDVISVFDENLNLMYINKGQEKISGFSREEVMGKNPVEFMHPDDIQRCISLFQEALKTGESFGEFRLRRKDNTYVWLEANVKITTDKRGKTKAVLVSRDINERKFMEKKLIETEEKYRHLFEHSPFSIVLIDLNGIIVDCNSATEKLIGYKREDLINENIRKLSMIHPNYLSIVANQFEKSKQGEILPSIDIQLRKKDGTLIWINYTTSLINTRNGNLMQVILHDITERKKAEALLFKEMNKLKELDQIRNDLITRISHELKTPLVSISGASELLLHYYNETLGVEELELIEMIDRGGKRLKYLVNNLIDISRFRHKKLTLKKQLHDMTLLIRECVKNFQFLIKEKNVNVTLNLPETSYLNFDRPRIEQVISNLLSNALKNTPPYGKIQIILQLNEDSAKISITDTGIGLTKDEMRRLFTQFGKIERYGQEFVHLNMEGAGLGLYISKEIVNLHDGQIWVESQGRYKGSTFLFKLPTK